MVQLVSIFNLVTQVLCEHAGTAPAQEDPLWTAGWPQFSHLWLEGLKKAYGWAGETLVLPSPFLWVLPPGIGSQAPIPFPATALGVSFWRVSVSSSSPSVPVLVIVPVSLHLFVSMSLSFSLFSLSISFLSLCLSPYLF